MSSVRGLLIVKGCIGRRVLRQPGEKEFVAEGQDDGAYKQADDTCVEKAADGSHEDDQHGHIDAATQYVPSPDRGNRLPHGNEEFAPVRASHSFQVMNFSPIRS